MFKNVYMTIDICKHNNINLQGEYIYNSLHFNNKAWDE